MNLLKFRTFVVQALAGLAILAGPELRADNLASIAITPATGEVALTPRWGLGGGLAGFHHMAQDLSLGGGDNQFYSIKAASIPSGGDVAAFTRYIAASGAATTHADIGSKLTPASYSALTSADPDLGYGSVNFYLIHHKVSGDYFTVIKPSSGTASEVTDLKPMSGPGGPATLGASGYFGLTFAAVNLGYGLNEFYYLRTDAVTQTTWFGALDPTLLGTSADKFDLGISGHKALAFTGTDVGFGVNQMYYVRLDPVTGFTIFGTLHPLTGKASDVANLGSVFTTLTFVPGDVGFGTGNFYTTGAVNPTWQSVSFAAIADRAISSGSFTVTPSASSGLPLTLTVVSGSTGAAVITGPVAGVFTVTPTAPGVINLQASQAGQSAPVAYEANMLRQSFTATGVALLEITTQPVAQDAIIGGNVSFTVEADGTTPVTYQWRKDDVGITGNASATTDTLVLTNVQVGDAGIYSVVVANASGSIPSDGVRLVVNATVTVTVQGPSGGVIILTPDGGLPPAGTTYYVKGLPKGYVLDPATGIITPPATVTLKPGTYRVTYGTIVTDGNGVKTRGPVLVLVIVVDPLPAALSGAFETILETPPAPGVPVGKMQLTVDARTGKFTGALVTFDRARIVLRGTLSLNASSEVGVASVVVKRGAGLAPQRLDLVLDATQAADRVFSATLLQLDVASVVVSTVGESDTGMKIATYTKAAPTPWAGRYTMLLDDVTSPPVNLGALPIPEGTGYGRVSVAASRGYLAFAGRLSDGTALTASLAPAADGSYRWFGKPYAKGGLFAGWVRFAPVAGEVGRYQVAGAGNSELYWAKTSTGASGQSYRAGFGPIGLGATAQRWTTPVSGTPLSTLLGLDESLMAATFTGVGLPDADQTLLPLALALDDRNRFVVVLPAANSDRFTLGLKTLNGSTTTATGHFGAGFRLQDARKITVGGAFLQQPAVVSGTVIGEGYFLIPPVLGGGEWTSARARFTAP